MGGNLVSFFMRLFSGSEDFMRFYPVVHKEQKVAKELFS